MALEPAAAVQFLGRHSRSHLGTYPGPPLGHTSSSPFDAFGIPTCAEACYCRVLMAVNPTACAEPSCLAAAAAAAAAVSAL
jgi:hypothetical protein